MHLDKYLSQRRLRRKLATAVFTSGICLGTATLTPGATPTKHTISYHSQQNTQSYNIKNRGAHVAIKVTPPKAFGQGQVAFIEIYNYTKLTIAQIDFDLLLASKSAFNFESHITGERILPGRSAVRKVAVGQQHGQKAFPSISKILISRLSIYDAAIKEQFPRIYVDLIKTP